MKKFLSSPLFLFIIASLSIGLVSAGLFLGNFFVGFSSRFYDNLFISQDPGQDIIIIAIDNQSLAEIGRWPWDRKVHAELLAKLAQAKPAIIGYDVMFADASNEESDQALAQAIKSANPVILAAEAELAAQDGQYIAENLIKPLPILADSAFSLGLANTPTDKDGILRKIITKITSPEEINSFSFQIASLYAEQAKRSFKQPAIDAAGQFHSNFFGPPGTFPTLSAASVLRSENLDNLEGKIVLVGATASDLHDEIMTPASRYQLMSGVEAHANAIKTLLANQSIRPLTPWLMAVIIVLAALLSGAALFFFRPAIAALLALGLSAIYLFLASALFGRNIFIDLFYFYLALLFSFLLNSVLKYFTEEKEKKFIAATFGRYVSPEIIRQLLADPEKIKLGGDKKNLTVMFCDIRGFTSLSEQLTPEELVSLLNKYLSAMTDIILENKGVVDKFIGDAIMAFWGAPVEHSDHAVLACRNALAMIKELTASQDQWQDEFGVKLDIGLGLNTGDLIIGNLGSDKRFDYTVIGDSVNLASRLEGQTKNYGVKIIVSEFTRKQAGPDFVFRILDKIAVKGKSQPVNIYELIAEKKNASSDQIKLAENFALAWDLYQTREWDKAITIFETILKNYPTDTPTQLYLERCRKLLANPPADWDGICRAETK